VIIAFLLTDNFYLSVQSACSFGNSSANSWSYNCCLYKLFS